jgi:hypothetical protein
MKNLDKNSIPVARIWEKNGTKKSKNYYNVIVMCNIIWKCAKKTYTLGCALLRDMCKPTKKYCSCSILEVICNWERWNLDKNSIPVARMWEKDAIDPWK